MVKVNPPIIVISFVVLFFLQAAYTLACIIVMRRYSAQADDQIVTLKNFENYLPARTHQVAQDWIKIPFTSLKVINGNETCPQEHPEEVIYQDFQGIQEHCTCNRPTRKNEFGETFKVNRPGFVAEKLG